MKSRIIALLLACAFAGCAKEKEGGPRFPARPEGCEVEVVREGPPSRPTTNIGPVSARCDESISQDDCLRTLKDQACKLGGDVVWGVPGEPSVRDGKQIWIGRAAHTTGATPNATGAPSNATGATPEKK